MNVETIFKKIYQTAQTCGYEVYVVGGFVRDNLLGKKGKDIDFVVVGDAMRFAEQLKKDMHLRTLVRYPRFGTFMTRYYGFELEFVNARAESYHKNSRNPVTEQTDLLTDLSRRDFTINTLAMHIDPANYGKIVDVYDGQKHLQRGLIKTPLDPDQTFSDDPLRMMRAIRFASHFNFTIEPETFEAITKNCERLTIVSQERITDEFNKVMLSEKPSIGLKMLEKSGLLAIILPEMTTMKGIDQKKKHRHKDVFYHTLEVIDNISQHTEKLKLRLAALFHDIGKPRTKRYTPESGWSFHGHEVVGRRMAEGIMKRMRYSVEITEYVKKLVNLHLRPMSLVSEVVTDSAVRRLIFLAGNDVDDLMVLCRADITSKNPARVKRYLANYDQVILKMGEVEERDHLRNFQPPVDGLEIMALFKIEPGPKVGKVKKFIEEAILNGEVANDHDACLDFIHKNMKVLD